MSRLENCPTCDNPTSENAEACPKCGEPLSANWAKEARSARQRELDKQSQETALRKKEKSKRRRYIKLGILAMLIAFPLLHESEEEKLQNLKDNKVDQAEQRPEAYDQSIKKNQGRSDGLPSPQETIWRMDAEKLCKQEIKAQVSIVKWNIGKWTQITDDRRMYRGKLTFVDTEEYSYRNDIYTCVFDSRFGNDFFTGVG